MLFPTTIAGSLPKPKWLADPERLWPDWRLAGDELRDAQRDAVRVAIFEQERSGVDIVTDGEQSRRHFVHGFAGALDGVDSTENQAARHSRRPLRGRVPDDRRSRATQHVPVHLDEIRFARDAAIATSENHFAGPDDDRRYPQRRVLRQPEGGGVRLRRSLTRRDSRARRRRRRRRADRRARFQRLFR